MRASYACLLVALAAACGSTQGNVLGDTPDGGPPGATPPGPTTKPTPPPPPGDDGGGGTLMPKACTDGDDVTSIAGTWDLVDSIGGTQEGTAILTIDAGTFSIARNATTLTFQNSGGAMTLSYVDKTRTTPINVSQTASAVDVGAFPFALGGSWTFASQTDTSQCTASLATDGFNASCNRVNGAPVVGTISGTLVGTRKTQLASIFGDLGGTWTFSSGTGTADVTFSANTFTSTTSHFGSHIPDGTFALRVCKKTVSGVTAGGFELAGMKQ